MMSICFTWFPISGLGEPKIYHQSVCITRMWELLGDCLTVKISGSYSQGMMGMF